MNKWKLIENKPNIKGMKKRESLWTQGNGYMGIRASFEEGYLEASRNTLINGVFDRAKGDVTELAVLPDATNFEIEIGGERFDMLAGTVEDYSASLDMYTGEFTRSLKWTSNGGRCVKLDFARMVSTDMKHIAAQKVTVTLLSDDDEITVKTGLDGKQTNTGVQHFGGAVKRSYPNGENGLYVTTLQSEVDVAAHYCILSSKSCDKSVRIDRRSVFTNASVKLKRGESVVFEKIISYATSRDAEYADKKAEFSKICDDGRNYLNSAKKEGYDALKKADSEKRAEYWRNNLTDIESGNSLTDTAVIFAQYHLSIMISPDDNRLGIGAKAMSGTGYMGHSFWDTEMFIFPYYLYTNPASARRLLEYRYGLLNAAEKKAEQYGFSGAMYPWESAWYDDGESCMEYGDLDLVTGERRKFDMGEKEIHVTAGIAYAVLQYYAVTNDEDFMLKYGNEMIVLTALFFASRSRYRNGRYEILDVIGPDEYKENVNNNTYTNYMAYKNMKAAEDILNDCPNGLRDKLEASCGFEKVKAKIAEVSEKFYLPKAEGDGIISQFDGCKDLKPVDISHYKKLSKVCAIFGDYGFADILKMQVYKQADLVMLFYLMDELFSKECIKRNFDYYEERTIHDSSLSLCIHALVAARAGEYALADDMFYRCCCVDVGDNTDNSDEGIHAASIGGIWLALVMGYGGLRVGKDSISLNPILPKGWKKYSFILTYRNTKFKALVNEEGCTTEHISGDGLVISIGGEERTV